MSLRFLVLLPLALALVACDQDFDPSPSDPIPGDDDDDGDAGGGETPASTGTSTGGGDGGAGQGGDGGAGPGPGPGPGSGGGGASSGVTVGAGGAGACDGGGASLQLGAPNRILIRGTIVTPSGPIDGEVLVDGNLIACVAASCAADPAADGATILDANGYVLPGLIDAHNHILFNVFDEDDWAPTQSYMNHNQWPNDPDYGEVVDAKQHLNGEGSDVELGCELLKYGEMKALIAGTTSVQGSPGTGKNCFGSGVRSIDTKNDLPADHMQTATIFPSNDAADGVCANFADGDTEAYLIHVGEGVDQTSRNEFTTLQTIGADDGCLISDETTIIHGTAFLDEQLTTMADAGMGLVWSPKSNIFLYGGGTDLTKTTDVPTALQLGITVSIAPDWSLGGSVNMLDELRVADLVDDTEWGDILTPRDLFEMATINPARQMKYDAYIGSLEEGKRADLFIIRENAPDPYEALLETLPRDVTLVMIDGQVLYGDASLEPLGPAGNACEPLEICCADKFTCLAEVGAGDKLDQTFAEIETALEQALGAYDPQYLPLAPIVRCPE